MLPRKFISYIEKLLKGVCNDAQEGDIYGDTFAIDYFMALVCGEELPEISDDDEGGNDVSIAGMCYFMNYERFAEDKLKIMPPEANLQIAEVDMGTHGPHCVMIGEGEVADENAVEEGGVPCGCSDPEIMKNMYNKGMVFSIIETPK